jgi:hypothetical protein
MTRFALACSLLVLAFAGPATASGPTAAASKTCKLTISQQRNSGATYVVQLNVTGVSCATGLKVEKAWQACRKKTAGRRSCKSRVLGYKSTQKILGESKVEYDAKVTATNGSRKVVFTYQQNK